MQTMTVATEARRCLSLSTFPSTGIFNGQDAGDPNVEVIPPYVTSLAECAVYQIQCLLAKEKDAELSAAEEDALDDGFFLCDLNVVRNKLSVWRRLFPRIHCFYAVKCNPDPMVAEVLGKAGAAFDCASVPEIQLALQSMARDSSRSQTTDTACNLAKLEESASRIVYANPQRAEQDLDRSLQLKVRALTFDGSEELYKIHRAYKNALDTEPTLLPPSMILRVLVPDEHSTVPLGEKFGAALDNIPSLVVLAIELKLPIVGVSFHCGSGNHDPVSYGNAIVIATEAMGIIDKLQREHGIQKCWLMDIGGGYPGIDGKGGDSGRFSGVDYMINGSDEPIGGKDTAANIANTVMPLLDKLFPGDDVQFIAEPGRYFVEAAFALCSRIYRVRVDEQGYRHYYIAQGVQGVFKDCVLCNESFVPIPLRLRDTSDETAISTVHGSSGEAYDVICKEYPLPILEVGDWLLFDRMGAYTLSIAARNGRPPIRYVMGSPQVHHA